MALTSPTQLRCSALALAVLACALVAAAVLAVQRPIAQTAAEPTPESPKGTLGGAIIPPGHPRILLNDKVTYGSLRQQLRDGTPAATRFRQVVDAQMSGKASYGFQPWFAALMYRLTGEASYARFAITQTDAQVLAEEARIARGQPAKVADDSYLDIGETIGNLALVHDWCSDVMAPSQRARWLSYANQAVWNIWHPKEARWGAHLHPWTGWSINNPSNNYYYSFLRATMLLGLASHGESEQAEKWLRTFRISKLEQELFPNLDRDLAGGGSREGTGYGTAMRGLFQLYDWWERSTGERLADRTPHTKASMAYLMHSTVPTLDHLAPTGDHSRDPSAALFDYHRDYMLELIALFPDEPLAAIGRTYLEQSSVPRMRYGFNAYLDFLHPTPEGSRRPLSDLATTYWAPGTGQLMMRSTWARDATFANFICGPLTESHAHRDQGSFVLYKNGWLAGDANTLSRSGLGHAEEMHNQMIFKVAGLVVKQRDGPGCKLSALSDNANFTFASARITAAYPHRLLVQEVERDFLFIKPDVFVVLDRAAVAPGVRQAWTLNLMVPPSIDGNHLRAGDGLNRLDVTRLAPEGVPWTVTAWTDTHADMKGGFRVEAASGAGPFLHVLGAAGSVTRAVRADRDGQIGAMIHMADGRTAVVHYDSKAPGGVLRISGPSGSSAFEASLPRTVETPHLLSK